MRRLLALLALLTFSGCATPPAVVTVHVDEDWASRGVYAVDSKVFLGVLESCSDPNTNRIERVKWKTAPSLTVKHDGRTIEMFSSSPGSRSLLFMGERGQPMLLLGGECILGGELREPIKSKEQSFQQQAEELQSESALSD